jgi:PKD repeat protein
MAKLRFVAVLVCALMVLVTGAPLVSGGDHLVAKGTQGPKDSAVTWTFEADKYAEWSAWIENHGLRWMVLDVCDNSSGIPELVLHQRIRFADHDAFPSGEVYSYPVLMAKGRIYEITATPNGPRDSYAVVTDIWPGNSAPFPAFVYSVDGLTLYVDASGSYDIDGWIVEYAWDWGDGTTGTGVMADHTYSMAGIYTVTLTVVDNLGASGSMSATTLPHNPPVAEFTYTINYHTILVDASSSYDMEGTIESYLWDWGDGSIGDGVTATHTYLRGSYTLTLTVVNNWGLTDTMSAFLVIDGVPIPPVAVFTWTTPTTDWYSVIVDGSQSYDIDGTIVLHAWDFGDGSTATGQTATHTYVGGGYYTITLEVTDNEGLTGVTEQYIQISPVLVSFVYSVDWLTVYVDASGIDSDGSIVSYAWDWGDGATATGVTAVHAYSAGGTYVITLAMTFNDGSIGRISQIVTVEAAPV